MPAAKQVQLTQHDALKAMLAAANKAPMLSQADEIKLARAWLGNRSMAAKNQLVTSHQRLVIKIAKRHLGYGLPLEDLISEGNVGLMIGIDRFDPDRGFRLSTYSSFWIRSIIQKFVIENWSAVKSGSTPAQKKLFFNLKKLKYRLNSLDSGDLSPENLSKIAHLLDVDEDEVTQMNRWMGGDISLNAKISEDSDEERQDFLVDESIPHDEELSDRRELAKNTVFLRQALKTLSERERIIFAERRLRDDPATLESLSQRFGVSRERIRQLEVRAFQLVEDEMKGRPKIAKKRKASGRFAITLIDHRPELPA